MPHNDAYTVRVYSTLNRMSKQRLPKHAGDTPTNGEERAVDRQAVPVRQAATKTSECTDDVRGRWTDDGGQNTTTPTDDAQSF
jgi:hypothetical protein